MERRCERGRDVITHIHKSTHQAVTSDMCHVNIGASLVSKPLLSRKYLEIILKTSFLVLQTTDII